MERWTCHFLGLVQQVGPIFNLFTKSPLLTCVNDIADCLQSLEKALEDFISTMVVTNREALIAVCE